MESTRRVWYTPLTARDDLRLLMAGTMTGGSGSGSRPYYLLHYVTAGGGAVSAGRERAELSAGSFFIHQPDLSVTYSPSRQEPWTYFWIAFDGPLAKNWLDGLLAEHRKPVFQADYEMELERLFAEVLKSLALQTLSGTMAAEAGMRHILSRLLARYGKEPDHNRDGETDLTITLVKGFMQRHFAEGITVADVCSVSGYDRTYFSNLFRQRTGQTLRDYLTEVRIEQACTLLRTTELTVEAIAQRVGYSGYRAFSRCFKKYRHESPRQYRKG